MIERKNTLRHQLPRRKRGLRENKLNYSSRKLNIIINDIAWERKDNFSLKNHKHTEIIYFKTVILDWNFIDIDKHQFFEIHGIYKNESLFSREEDSPQLDSVQILKIIQLMSNAIISSNSSIRKNYFFMIFGIKKCMRWRIFFLKKETLIFINPIYVVKLIFIDTNKSFWINKLWCFWFSHKK